MTIIEARRRKRARRERRNRERSVPRIGGLPASMRDFAADMLADAIGVSRERLDEIWNKQP